MKDLVYPLSDRQINWRPHYDKWSILDNILHISQTNRFYLDSIRGKLSALRHSEKRVEQKAEWSLQGRFILYLMEPPYRLRFKAPEKLISKKTLSREEVAHQFLRIHSKIETLLEEASFYRLTGQRFFAPASKRISFSFVEIVSVLAAHERRHLWQAEQIVSLTLFPQK